MKKNQKPELLLPAGNLDMALAAFEGGADAVYAGLSDFNARKRARNFSYNEMYSLIDHAEKTQKKVYLTLNTLVKNKETFDIIDILSRIVQMNPAGIIIQDWGMYYILKKHFPSLPLHASTQMGLHNSLGAIDALEKGFKRIILARELTFSELKTISTLSNIELEIFVHGSLCYSFSGYCLFSSYLGGMSANRGLCKQPCRRLFNIGKEQQYLFSLKDLQLIEMIPEIMKLGISSLKIEGRMKSIDYVYKTAKAYRMVINDNNKIMEAKKLLQEDMSREKTSYFMGEELQNVFTETPSVGKLIGAVEEIREKGIVFETCADFHKNSKIRIVGQHDLDADIIEVNLMSQENNPGHHLHIAHKGMKINLEINTQNIEIGDEIYLISDKTDIRLPKITIKKFNFNPMTSIKKQVSKNNLHVDPKRKNKEIFLRIDHPDWIPIIPFDQIKGLFLNFTKRYWQDKQDFIESILPYKDKIIIEFPVFISEDNILYYRDFVKDIIAMGFSNFSISHISQKHLFPKQEKLAIYSNENIYGLNDFAIQFLKTNEITQHIYPYENDIDNLLTGTDRSGIIPLYYFPKLFYSRMPLNVRNDEMFNDTKNEYQKFIRDGMTIISAKAPVSLYQYTEKLLNKGFNRFLADLSFTIPDVSLINKLLNGFEESSHFSNSGKFNFKKGLW